MSQRPENEPVPGPLGWLEFTVRVIRDRAHAGWAWLSDDELLRAVHERGGVAAYLPGERIGTRDQILLRLAVDPEGRVALAEPGAAPEAGPQLEDFVMGVLEELRVLALIDDETAVGPPGLPADRLRHDAQQPDPDTRQAYAWTSEEPVVGGVLASVLQQPVALHQEGGWTIGTVAHQSALVLREPPVRGPVTIFPFVALDRRGELRSFTYAEGRKPSQLRVHVEWGPPLQAAPPPDAHPDTLALARWLAEPEPGNSEDLPRGPEHTAPSAEQKAVIDRVLASGDGSTVLAELCTAFGVPALAAQLVEVPHGSPDPVAPDRTAGPDSRRGLIGQVLVDANSEEPTGRGPWAALERAIFHRPRIGLVLGFVELLIAGALIAAVLNGALSPWWWIAVAVLVLIGIEHTGSAVLRQRALQRERGQEPREGG